MNNHIQRRFTTLLIQSLARSLRGAQILFRQLSGVFSSAKKPLATFGRITLRLVLVPSYKIYLSVKKILTKFYAPHIRRHRLIHPFSRRYLTHIVIVGLSVFTITNNLSASEIQREDFGQTTIVSQLAGAEDYDVITEEGPITDTNRVSHYLGTTAVETRPALEGTSDLSQPPTAVAGSAVVGQILSPLEQELRQRDTLVYYTVQGGDTISGIAEQFSVSVSTILWENNLTAYSLIRPGDNLAILPETGIRHSVARGETLAAIAKKYSTEVDKIIDANTLASADDIQVGEKLLIPDGIRPVVVAARTVSRPAASAPATPAANSAVGGEDWTWPSECQRLTQYFTWRHTGVDIACKFGSAIYASKSGTVVEAEGGWNGGYGLMVVVDHGDGVRSLYGHLSAVYVKVGETVTQGQTIAAEGSTGRSTGPHVHFEIRIGGSRKNPLTYLR